jgi:hypothetical protein
LAKISFTCEAFLAQEPDAHFVCGFAQVVVKRRQRQIAPNGQIEVDRVVAG